MNPKISKEIQDTQKISRESAALIKNHQEEENNRQENGCD